MTERLGIFAVGIALGVLVYSLLGHSHARVQVTSNGTWYDITDCDDLDPWPTDD